MGDVLFLLVLVAPLFGIWYLLIRPAQRRQRELADVRSSLAPGQDVMTTSGLHGRIRGVLDDVVLLEVADGVVLRFAAGAIAVVSPAGGPAESPDAPEA
ncbi:MAG TPA: preprotein translocase subunit YajC [Actinomycetes bacterium]|jgi:preprotein translocase subunit YajC|nr:preprotein translocase subunit YajC [Actinomycetes bacterium]